MLDYTPKWCFFQHDIMRKITPKWLIFQHDKVRHFCIGENQTNSAHMPHRSFVRPGFGGLPADHTGAHASIVLIDHAATHRLRRHAARPAPPTPRPIRAPGRRRGLSTALKSNLASYINGRLKLFGYISLAGRITAHFEGVLAGTHFKLYAKSCQRRSRLLEQGRG
jgi:hypothetical protein